MALVISSSSPLRKPSMLKDFLLDDLGSCSSSGFRSLPRRRHSCAAIQSRRLLNPLSKSASSSKISRAIRKASMAIIAAVKLLPLPEPAKKKAVAPRSRSWGLFRRSSSEADERCRDYEIDRWISSSQPLDLTDEMMASTTITTTFASTTSSANGDCWSESDSEFTVPCSVFDESGVVEGKAAECMRCGVSAVNVGDNSLEAATTKKKWSDEEEKDLSPVSVFDFRDDDEETGSSSPFMTRLNHLEVTKEKLKQKLVRFECLSRISSINLESRLSMSEYSEEDEEEGAEEMVAERLLKLIRTKTDGCKFNVESILLGFFEDELAKGRGRNGELVEETLLKEAEDWLVGRAHGEGAKGWKVKEKRKVDMEDMEGGVWRSSDFDKEEVAGQVEAHVLASLVDELVRELA